MMRFLVLLSFCVLAQGSPWLSSLNFFNRGDSSVSTPSTTTNSSSFLSPVSSFFGLFSNLAVDKRDVNYENSQARSPCFLSRLMESLKNVTTSTIDGANNAIKTVGKTGTKILSKVGAFPLNRGADVLVSRVKTYMKNDEIELPNLQHGFSFITLDAQNGKFGQMGSLKRNGDVSFYLKGKYLFIEIPLQFDNIYVDYDFNLISFFELQGGLRAEVNSNNFVLKLRLSTERNCVVSLQSVQVTDFNGIDIKFKGLDQASEEMIKYTIDEIKDDLDAMVKQQVQATIDNKIVEYTQDNNIKCSDFE